MQHDHLVCYRNCSVSGYQHISEQDISILGYQVVLILII